MLIISNVSHKDLASYQCKTQSGARSKFQIIQQVPSTSTQLTTTEKSPKGKKILNDAFVLHYLNKTRMNIHELFDESRSILAQ